MSIQPSRVLIISISCLFVLCLRFRIDIVNPPSQTSSNFWTMTLLDHFAKPIPSFPLWAFPEISVSTFARNSAPSCYLGDCVGAGGIAIPTLGRCRSPSGNCRCLVYGVFGKQKLGRSTSPGPSNDTLFFVSIYFLFCSDDLRSLTRTVLLWRIFVQRIWFILHHLGLLQFLIFDNFQFLHFCVDMVCFLCANFQYSHQTAK